MEVSARESGKKKSPKEILGRADKENEQSDKEKAR
jgi:hypothetical protein